MSPPEILLEVVLLISSIIASVVIDKVHSNGHNKLKSAASREVALAQRRSEPVKRYGWNSSGDFESLEVCRDHCSTPDDSQDTRHKN